MTAQELAYACLGYIGEFSLTLGEHADQSAGVFRSIALSINRSQQQIFELNPSLFKREVGVLIPAPEQGTVTVTGNSATIAATTLAGPMVGNCIKIDGETPWNGVFTEGAAKKLICPYNGPSGTRAATLYGDAIALSSAYSKPLGPVWLSDIRMLPPITSKGEFLGYDPRQALNGDWGRLPYGATRTPVARMIGQPEAHFVESHLLENGQNLTVIRLTPLPDKAYTLRFDAEVRPAPVLVADFGTEGAADPGRGFSLPPGLDEKFLVPLVLYYWSASPFFKNAEVKKQLFADYGEAIPQIEAYKIQPQTGGHICTGGYR